MEVQRVTCDRGKAAISLLAGWGSTQGVADPLHLHRSGTWDGECFPCAEPPPVCASVVGKTNEASRGKEAAPQTTSGVQLKSRL